MLLMPKTPKKTETGRIIIVAPTHGDLLFQTRNPKEVHAKVQKDGSNFDKVCRLEHDLRLSTYALCSSAFEKDTIILHVSPKLIDNLESLSLLRKLKDDYVGVYTINVADFLSVIFRQMEKEIVLEFWQITKQVLRRIELSEKEVVLARLLRDGLTEILQRYENQ